MVKTGRAMTSLYPDKISERKTTNGASKNK